MAQRQTTANVIGIDRVLRPISELGLRIKGRAEKDHAGKDNAALQTQWRLRAPAAWSLCGGYAELGAGGRGRQSNIA